MPDGPKSGDKPPGKWKFHEVEGPSEAKAWLEDKIARGYKCSISAYKVLEEDYSDNG